LRLTPGEIFVAFDGMGGEWDCALTAITTESGAKGARAAILNERATAPAGRLHLSIAQAIPKGEKMEWVLQKGTELGVAEFWPFQAGRSVPIWTTKTVRIARRQVAQNRAGSRSAVWPRRCPVVHAVCEFATAVDYGTVMARVALCWMNSAKPMPCAKRCAASRCNGMKTEAFRRAS
jgi:16S rRNA (uracil1498-N3)-methyltransferase